MKGDVPFVKTVTQVGSIDVQNFINKKSPYILLGLKDVVLHLICDLCYRSYVRF